MGKCHCLPSRVTLAIMGFLMFLVTQMIRVNLYIALVPITEPITTNSTDNKTGVNSSEWNSSASGLVLSAFYWSYWATELPGGLLAQKYGGRRVLGIGVTFAGLLNLLLPMSIGAHYLLAAGIRALQGLALGVTWPAMHWLSARWIPPAERGKFMTVYHGSAVGTAITYPLSGVIIQQIGWQWVFYCTGLLSVIWSVSWWFFVYDSPSNHPRISTSEKAYLEEQIGESVASRKNKSISTPWKSILHSRPFWGVLMASQGLMWGTITLSMQTPPYFRHLHGLDIKTIGFFSGIPEVCKFGFSLTFSSIVDKAIKSKKLSVTQARKISVAVCEYLPAILLVFLGIYGSSGPMVALILLTLTNTVGGASSSGSLANIVDLSPNHAGTILGLIKTLTIIPGVVSPLIAAHLTRNGVDPAVGWRNVMLLTALVYTICSTSFQFCGSGKVQHWNQAHGKSEEEAEKMQDLKRSNHNHVADKA